MTQSRPVTTDLALEGRGDFPLPPAAGTMDMSAPPHRRRSQPVQKVASPRIDALGDDPDPAAVQRFWADVAAAGTPLIEDVRDGEATYTFVYRGDDRLRRVGLVTNRIFDPADYEQALLRQVAGTDIWWLSLRRTTSWRGSYALAADRGEEPAVDPAALAAHDRRRRHALTAAPEGDHAAIDAWFDLLRHATPDPYCRRGAARSGLGSVAAGPDAPTDEVFAPAPVGRIIPVNQALPVGPGMWWHVPARPAPARWNTLVLLDGERWIDNTATLDAWTTAGVIPPSATLIVAAGDLPTRTATLTCSPDFVATLLRVLAAAPPELGAPLSRRPEDTRIAGQSLGGLTALYAQCVAPEVFGVSICQSGSFWWPNAAGGGDSEWLTAAIRGSRIRLGHVYLEAGLAESPLIGPVRRLREVLIHQTRELRYREFDGGHDIACWMASLPHALRGSWAGRWADPAPSDGETPQHDIGDPSPERTR